MTSKRLLLIDGHSVAFRAFYALPVENFTTASGAHTNAVFGFTSMLINLLRDEEPTHVAVAFDVSRQTFRTEEYPEYKGTRDKAPPEFKPQIDLIKDVLDALGIQRFEKDGFEADDVIGTLATSAADAGFDVLISTGDRDALQLVTETVTVLYPKRGVSDLARMTPAAVEEKYAVPPERYSDLAALVGESSDNLPGVPGVGPKTAAKWIAQYGSLSEIVNSADQVGGKAGQSLRDHLDGVLRNRRLNALVCDLDLGAAPDDLERKPWDRDAIHRVFDALEFAVLRDRLFDALDGDGESGASGSAVTTDITIAEAGQVASWLEANAGAGSTVGLEVTGALGPVDARADSLAVASDAGPALWVSTDVVSPEDDEALAAWLADADRRVVMHEAKSQIHALTAQGWALEGLEADTALAGYLVRPDQRSYDLSDFAVRYLQREIGVPDGSGQLSLDDTADADEAVQRARAALDLWAVLAADVDDHGATSLMRDVELPLVPVLGAMESVGIAVDDDHLEALQSEFAGRAAEAADEAHAVIGREVNLGSPKQLQAVLFDELNMRKTKRTKTGYTTDAEALRSLFAETQHPFLEHLLAYRDVTKLKQTVEGLRKTIAPDGRIHTTFQQTIAATGRLSSKDPNLQNIPIRTESGRRIREGFCVGEGYETLVTADYSQIEMRIMAHLSEDADLIEAFRSGEDFHTVTAAKVFDTEPDAIDTELRSRIKAMNYGLAYGLSSYGLSQQLGITPVEAQGLMDDYFVGFGGVRDYLQGIVDDARASGYTATMMGRRRYLPDLNADNRQRREMAERMALNAPIQGSAADIIKVAMLNVQSAIDEAGLDSRLLLQVHDELVMEVAKGELDQVTAILQSQMGSAADLAVDLEVSVGTGRTWFEAAH